MAKVAAETPITNAISKLLMTFSGYAVVIAVASLSRHPPFQNDGIWGGARMRALAIATALMAVTSTARAEDIHALITTAMETAIAELVPPFERSSGDTVRLSYGPSGAVARRFIGGEPADVVVIDSNAIDELIKQGRLLPGRTDIAQTGIGIAVRKGAPRPDVSTPEALKRALLAAKSIGYTSPTGGGITVAPILKLLDTLGIAAEVAPKTKFAAGGPNGRVSVLVSSGEAEIGLQQVSELMSNPDVEVIGMLPAELQRLTVYSAGIAASAQQPAGGRALIQFLAAPEAKAIYKTKGLAL
jgi:molybdate transport system substrate-binding protein